jgi:hypothetical protein
MASEAVGPDGPATARHDAASRGAGRPFDATWLGPVDAAAIGYEAAHPALQSPQWTEAMELAARPLR